MTGTLLRWLRILACSSHSFMLTLHRMRLSARIAGSTSRRIMARHGVVPALARTRFRRISWLGSLISTGGSTRPSLSSVLTSGPVSSRLLSTRSILPGMQAGMSR